MHTRSVGARDGVTLGVSLGVEDGVALGVSLGVEDGVTLGTSDGLPDGEADGTSLGTTELLGLELGAEEGCSLASRTTVNARPERVAMAAEKSPLFTSVSTVETITSRSTPALTGAVIVVSTSKQSRPVALIPRFTIKSQLISSASTVTVTLPTVRTKAKARRVVCVEFPSM